MEGGALRRVAKALRRHAGPQARRTRPLHLLFQKPHRKRPVHFPSVAVGFQSIIIFLTLCTRHRKPLLANNEAARLIIEPWRAANFWRVGRYVIMPNYIHLFCAPNTVPAQLPRAESRIGKITLREHGRVVPRSRFGNASIGIGSCAGPNPMERSGTTWRTIRCATARRTQCAGVARPMSMEGGALRRLTKAVRLSRGSRGSQELAPPFAINR